MRKNNFIYMLAITCSLLAGSLALSGCELVGDIFKAGVWVGVLAVIGVVALILFLLRKK
jgi:hypothetical protein